jgi:cytosine/adenosine deaminase-related metal-dependent hydrolase
MLDKQGAIHDVEAQQEETEEEEEAEAQEEFVDTEYIGKDSETKWTVIESGRGASGRFGSHNVLREQPGPTPHGTRSVSEEKVSSAWRLFVDDSILRHIKHCTEAEAARAGEQNWSYTASEYVA